ncbi:MAG: hypothetical protein QOC92_2814 [Acidimicrobiaceae bacterium]|jgi:hypothetical protein
MTINRNRNILGESLNSGQKAATYVGGGALEGSQLGKTTDQGPIGRSEDSQRYIAVSQHISQINREGAEGIAIAGNDPLVTRAEGADSGDASAGRAIG